MLLAIMSLMPVFGFSSVYFGQFRILLTSLLTHTSHVITTFSRALNTQLSNNAGLFIHPGTVICYSEHQF